MSGTRTRIDDLPLMEHEGERTGPRRGAVLPMQVAREFRRRVQDIASGVLVLQERSMQRLMQAHLSSSILAPSLPRMDYFLMPRADFLAGLEDENPDALSMIEGMTLPDLVILMPLPSPVDLASAPLERMLRLYWAIRTEATVARTWQMARERDAAHADGAPATGFDRDGLERLVGSIAMRELESVMLRERRILEAASDAEVVRSFVACAVRLSRFQEGAREQYFPAIEDWPAVDAWIETGGVDAGSIVASSRPGALPGESADREDTRRVELPLQHDRRLDPWRGLDPARAEVAAARERERCQQAACRRLGDLSELRHASLFWLVFTNLVEWMALQVVSLVRNLLSWIAPGLDLVTPIVIAAHGYAVRSHVRGAQRAEAVGNAGEVLRRTLEAGWHLRALTPPASAGAVDGTAPADSSPPREALQLTLAEKRQSQIEIVGREFAETFGDGEIADSQICELLDALSDPRRAGRRAMRGRLVKDLYKAALDHRRSFARIQLLAWFVGLLRPPMSWLLRLLADVIDPALDAPGAGGWRGRAAARWRARAVALEVGRPPLKRPLAHQSEIRALRHLRAARRKFSRLAWTNKERERLGAPLYQAFQLTRERLRRTLGPPLEQALLDAGLTPRSPRQVLALAKMREELLDLLEDRWHLRFADLRDAIARNDLRLEDPTARELLSGDELTRLNRLLARNLFGVYERAEAYVQVLQRGSTLMFASTVGRFLTRYVILPYVGAYMVIQGFAHIFDPISHVFGGPQILGHGDAQAQPGAPGGGEVTLPTPGESGHMTPGQVVEHATGGAGAPLLPWVIGLGTVLLLVIHTSAGRRTAMRVWRGIAAAFRLVFVTSLQNLFSWRPLERLLKAPATRIAARWGLQPLLLGLILVSPWLIAQRSLPESLALPMRWRFFIGFVIGFVLINSKSGRSVLDTSFYVLGASWGQFKDTLVIGLFRLIMDLSNRALNLVEAAIYRVDDFLRFRDGESFPAAIVKGMFQAIWSTVTYLTRLYVNVLIEPQINPIKHFPVVTVSHKLMIPWLPVLTLGLKSVLDNVMPGFLSATIAGITIFLLPGLFGFLVWEFKENWKLYAANIPAAIKPVVVGSHGESMITMLRRGFHAGTVPKDYDRIRHTLGAAWRGRSRVKLHAARSKLHHSEDAVRRFLDRELVASIGLDERVAPAVGAIEVSELHLATESVRATVALGAPGAPAGAQLLAELMLDIHVLEKKLLAEVELRSPSGAGLSVEARRALATLVCEFLQRAAAVFDPAAVEMALLPSTRAG